MTERQLIKRCCQHDRVAQQKLYETYAPKMLGICMRYVKDYHVDVVVMGSDWENSDRFDYLKDYCELVFLPRTPGISTTKIKHDLGLVNENENAEALMNH